MKPLVNFEFGALNVVTGTVDAAIVAEFDELSRGPFPEPDFASVRPSWSSDLEWVSANTPATFALFQSAFDRLGVAEPVRELMQLHQAPRLYAGFFLLRTSCTDTNFHVDWCNTGTNAFTFITPLDDHARDFGIVYRKITGKVGEYAYKPGEGIIFGEHFWHSTKPGRSEKPVRLLCFQFGTDRMERWNQILDTAGSQSLLIQQPDGRFAVRASWQDPDWVTLRRSL